MAEHFRFTRFFKELKMAQPQLMTVGEQLLFKRLPRDSYVASFGQDADNLYIVLAGEVSVWAPVAPAEMVTPLQKFKSRVKSAILADSADSLNFTFKFHVDLDAVEEGRRPTYCTMSDFKKLCSKETPPELVDFLWRQF